MTEVAVQNPAPAEEISLFDLFTEFDCVEIKDSKGRAKWVAVKALDTEDNAHAQEFLEEARLEAAKFFESRRGELTKRFEEMALADLQEFILAMEVHAAVGSLDLIPGYDPKMSDDEKKKLQEDAVSKWRTSRKAELTSKKIAVATATDRQLTISIRTRAAQLIMDEVLCMMVYGTRVNPETGERYATSERLLSPKKGEKNYIGRLMPAAKQALVNARMKYLADRSEQALRRTSESPAFLASGNSPDPSPSSPGETTETPSSSPATSSSSTQNGNG